MFELPKRHKAVCKYNWKKTNIIFNDNFDEWYARYINSNECEKCNEPYKSLKDRCMDHDHNTGEPRNILCNSCNIKTDRITQKTNKLGLQYIYKQKTSSYVCGFCYIFRLKRDNKVVIQKYSKDLEKLIKYRDEFIKDNPQYF
tara:strand:- start:1290 stop:1718 length:429 start_codon:yes stop_codon:yes gene_type:complete